MNAGETNPYQSPMACNPPATDRPLWVRIGLWEVPNRKTALIYFRICLVIGLIFVIPLLSAWWYLACMRWMDEHDQW